MSRARGQRRLPWSQFSSPPPPPVGRRSTGGRPPNPGSFRSRSVSTTDLGKVAGMVATPCDYSLLLLGCCLPLWNEVVFRRAVLVLVRAALDADGERRGLPFERGGLPGVFAGGCAAPGAPDDVDEEKKLGGGEYEGRPGDPTLHGQQQTERGGAARDLRIVARPTSQALQMHGKESAIGGDKREPEVPATEMLAHKAPGHQREPVVNPRKDGKGAGHGH